MVLNQDDILKHIRQEKYHGEIDEYKKSMSRLPNYDNSKFYSHYASDSKTITQGDVIKNLKIINLPSTNVKEARGMVFSSTCDTALENERKFSSRIIYAPLSNLKVYEAKLRVAKDSEGKEKFTTNMITDHIESIKKQEVGQILYLPKGMGLDSDAIVFFDRVISYPNDAVSRNDLKNTRAASLSLYGWHVFMERLAYFFTKTTDDTVELRLNTAT